MTALSGRVQPRISRWVLLVLLVLAACSNPRVEATPTPTSGPTPTPTPAYDESGRQLPVTVIRENIAEDTIWAAELGPYHLQLPIQVKEGVTLTILPGTIVYTESGTSINVQGTLNADGVRFEPLIQTHTWEGLSFFGPTPSTISNSVITSTKNAISCRGGMPNLIGNSIGPTQGNAILCFVESLPTYDWLVSGNSFFQIGEDGILLWVSDELEPGGALQIANNSIITTGGMGIGVGSEKLLAEVWGSDTLNLTISGNIIRDTQAEGILLQFVSGVLVRQNTISGVQKAAVALQPAYNVTVDYNWLSGSSRSGLVIEETNGQPARNVFIQCNLIDWNAQYGVEILRRNTANENEDAGEDTVLLVTGNEIVNNGNKALVLTGEPIDLNASNNWWGTTDPGAVGLFIHDKADDPFLGTVQVEPLRVAPPVREFGACP